MNRDQSPWENVNRLLAAIRDWHPTLANGLQREIDIAKQKEAIAKAEVA